MSTWKVVFPWRALIETQSFRKNQKCFFALWPDYEERILKKQNDCLNFDISYGEELIDEQLRSCNSYDLLKKQHEAISKLLGKYRENALMFEIKMNLLISSKTSIYAWT